MVGLERFKNRVNRRQAGIALASLALVAAGCKGAADGQVGSTDLVDCQKGPLTNSQTFDLPEGKSLEISNHRGWGTTIADVAITSKGNGLFSFLQVPPEVIFDSATGNFSYNQDNIHYNIAVSKGAQETTHLIVDLNCVMP